MYRVIIASGFDRYNGTHGNENMTDDQILWEEMHDAWQEACEKSYKRIIESGEISKLTYGRLVDQVASEARVKEKYAKYFVDKFMSWEPSPLPLKSDEDSMEEYLWEIIGDISNAGIFNISLANDWDHVVIDFERTNDPEKIEKQVIDAFTKEGFDPIVIYNTGTEIVLEVPNLENPGHQPLKLS